MSTAEYQKKWRARHGARTGVLGRPRTEGCGTPAGYNWHKRHDEVACTECRRAWADYQKDRRAARSEEKKLPLGEHPMEGDYVLLDVLATDANGESIVVDAYDPTKVYRLVPSVFVPWVPEAVDEEPPSPYTTPAQVLANLRLRGGDLIDFIRLVREEAGGSPWRTVTRKLNACTNLNLTDETVRTWAKEWGIR